MLFPRYFVALTAATLSLSTAAYAENGSKIFSQKCSGCHTIGGGPMVGPDLAGVSTWKTSDTVDAIKRMETSVGPLSGDEVDALVQYLKTPTNNATSAAESAATTTGATAEAKPVEQTSTSKESPEGTEATSDMASQPGSAETGKRLFLGAQPFANGGASCVACHSGGVSGGTMGPDLTNIAERLNERALIAASEKTSFPVMRAAYANHPVTKQEAIDLAKYFVSLKGTVKQDSQLPPVGAAGAAGATLMLGLIAWGYRNRNTSVRSKLQRRK